MRRFFLCWAIKQKGDIHINGEGEQYSEVMAPALIKTRAAKVTQISTDCVSNRDQEDPKNERDIFHDAMLGVINENASRREPDRQRMKWDW